MLLECRYVPIQCGWRWITDASHDVRPCSECVCCSVRVSRPLSEVCCASCSFVLSPSIRRNPLSFPIDHNPVAFSVNLLHSANSPNTSLLLLALETTANVTATEEKENAPTPSDISEEKLRDPMACTQTSESLQAVYRCTSSRTVAQTASYPPREMRRPQRRRTRVRASPDVPLRYHDARLARPKFYARMVRSSHAQRTFSVHGGWSRTDEKVAAPASAGTNASACRTPCCKLHASPSPHCKFLSRQNLRLCKRHRTLPPFYRPRARTYFDLMIQSILHA